MSQKNPVTRWLETTDAVTFNAYCIIAAFCTYFCMYAFRKPFYAGEFAGNLAIGFLPDINYKIALIISQVFGYSLSKFIGIKIISELKRHQRALAIIIMLMWAELALLFFAIVPNPYNIIFLFLNGIPLGMIWGCVCAFLEGRTSTEVLASGLSASYIIASGVVKDVGRWLMELGISEFWMPFVTGALFFIPMLGFVYLLKLIPAPSAKDKSLRTVRIPMNAKHRWAFFVAVAPGLILLTGLYMFLTAYRDFRDSFMREILDQAGYQGSFTNIEMWVAFGVLGALAMVMVIKNNKWALYTIHVVMLVGAILIGISTLCYERGIINPLLWLIGVGLGVYIAYVPFGCILFDRMIAYIGFVATAGFLIYIADAFGYTCTVLLLLYKNFVGANISYKDFFIVFSYVTSIISSIAFMLSLLYFACIDPQKKQLQLQQAVGEKLAEKPDAE